MGSRNIKEILHSFRPVVDGRSRILILGTMPGPVALARQEYYGFPGNHFWKIMADLFKEERPLSYADKIRLLKQHRIALWDTIRSCRRAGASDSSITDVVPNDIDQLLRKYPNILRIFLNGRTAERLYRIYFDGEIKISVHYLPSTSPAHASLSYRKKLREWRVVKKYLMNSL